MSYKCEVCPYETSIKGSFTKHEQSKKHQKNVAEAEKNKAKLKTNRTTKPKIKSKASKSSKTSKASKPIETAKADPMKALSGKPKKDKACAYVIDPELPEMQLEGNNDRPFSKPDDPIEGPVHPFKMELLPDYVNICALLIHKFRKDKLDFFLGNVLKDPHKNKANKELSKKSYEFLKSTPETVRSSRIGTKTKVHVINPYLELIKLQLVQFRKDLTAQIVHFPDPEQQILCFKHIDLINQIIVTIDDGSLADDIMIYLAVQLGVYRFMFEDFLEFAENDRIEHANKHGSKDGEHFEHD